MFERPQTCENFFNFLRLRREHDGELGKHIIFKSKLVACSTQSEAYRRVVFTRERSLQKVVICHVDEHSRRRLQAVCGFLKHFITAFAKL